MGGTLLAVEHPVDHPSLDGDPLPNCRRRLGQQGLGRAGRLACERDQLDAGVMALSFVQHRRSPGAAAATTTLRVQCTNATPEGAIGAIWEFFVRPQLHFSAIFAIALD